MDIVLTNKSNRKHGKLWFEMHATGEGSFRVLSSDEVEFLE